MLARLLALLGAVLTAAVLALVPLLLRDPSGVRAEDLARWLPLAGFLVAASAVGFGWTRLLQVPTGWGVGWIVALTGAAGGLLVTLDGADGLRWIPPALAIGIIVAFVHQMGRRDGRPRLVESVSATVTGQGIVLLGTGWLVTGSGSTPPGLIAGTGCTVAVLVMTMPLPRQLTLPLAAVAAALAGGAVAGQLDAVGVLSGLLTGAVAGTATAGLHVLLFRQPTASYRRAAVAAGVASVLAAGLAVHIGSRLTGQ